MQLLVSPVTTSAHRIEWHQVDKVIFYVSFRRFPFGRPPVPPEGAPVWGAGSEVSGLLDVEGSELWRGSELSRKVWEEDGVVRRWLGTASTTLAVGGCK